MNIPDPPSGFVRSKAVIYRGILPRLIELGALPGAIQDLKDFFDYTTALGTAAPAVAQVIATFDMARLWSNTRTASSIWDDYAQSQEEIAWVAVRPVMMKLKPVFDAAAASDHSLYTRFSSLAAFLGAKQSIAKKGAATRAANKQAIAQGKPPIHGQAGKKRQKATDKAIVAAANAGKGTTTTPPADPHPTAPPATATTNGGTHS